MLVRSNIAPQRRTLRALPTVLGFAVSALILSACADRQDIVLPGERVGLRDVLVSQTDPVGEVDLENQERGISLAAATSNPEWPQFWGTPSARTAHPALNAELTRVWSTNIGAGNTRRARISADPVVGGDLIFTLDAGSVVTATTLSGAVAWRKDLAIAPNERHSVSGGGLTYADGRLYVGLGLGILTALNASDGATLWTQDLEGTATGAPTVSGDLVYLVSGDDTGWALETENGRVRWQVGAGQDVNNVFGAPAPVVSGDIALFAFGTGDVQAVFRRGGLRRWDASVVGERRGFALSKVNDVTAGPVIVGQNVFAGNQSGRVVSLSLGSGKRNWTALEGAIGPIWPAGDSIFFVSDRNELIRMDAETGDRIWGAKLPNFVKDRPKRRAEVFAHFGPVLAGGRLVVASSDGLLRSYDPTDGSELGSVEIPGGAASAPAIAGGTLYVVSTRGELVAFR